MKIFYIILATVAITVLAGWFFFFPKTNTVSITTPVTAPAAVVAPIQDDTTKQEISDLNGKLGGLADAVQKQNDVLQAVLTKLSTEPAPTPKVKVIVQPTTAAAPQDASTQPTDMSTPGATAQQLNPSPDSTDSTQPTTQVVGTAPVDDLHQHPHYFSSNEKTGPNGEINPGKWVCGNGYRIPSAARLTERIMNNDHSIHWLYVGFSDINNTFHPFPADKLIEIGTPPEGYPLDDKGTLFSDGRITAQTQN